MLFEIENLHFLLLHVVIECNIYDMIVMLLKISDPRILIVQKVHRT